LKSSSGGGGGWAATAVAAVAAIALLSPKHLANSVKAAAGWMQK